MEGTTQAKEGPSPDDRPIGDVSQMKAQGDVEGRGDDGGLDLKRENKADEGRKEEKIVKEKLEGTLH